ncbi:MAG TPA: ribosome-associated translation inhibitor RaiA [Candidatus Saccharimonadales bacterium]|nr:ribosome-associated translation inhibitor RaiA [Candidatus Saccharimonadales bacterium]
MLQKFEIQSVHMKPDDNLKKYITKKIGNLDKYLSRHNKLSAHAEVLLKESKASDRRQATCEVVLHLPKETITVKESTINMYAAVDIVESKLKQQIQKYKDLHHSGKMHRHLFARLRQQSDAA